MTGSRTTSGTATATAAVRRTGEARYLIAVLAQALEPVLRFDAPADATLAQFMREHRQLGGRDRQLLGDAVYALLRAWRLALHWLAQGEQPMPREARMRRLALLGLALQAGGAAPVPLPGASALQIVQRARALSTDGGDTDWLDACTAQMSDGLPEACQHNLPDWLADTLAGQWGRDTFWTLIAALRQPAPLDVRVNILRAKRSAVQQQLAAIGLSCQSTPYSPWGLRFDDKPSLQRSAPFQDGLIEVQDEGSQLLALLSDARRNETVVDFCAGAGGKTLALGAMMRNTGRLYAFDNSAHRLAGLQPRLQRSGLLNVHTMALQGERDERLQRLAGKVDRVLVDAPCSGLGTLRRHPDLAWRTGPNDVASLQAAQLAILQQACRLLKPGGQLIYATCSLLDAENSVVRAQFASEQPDLEPLDWQPLLKKHRLEAFAVADNALQLLPHRSNTDGFYACAWRKQA
ncbi:RsmB/NOP family class I SAM-dependent RNA methyltransferase [Corticibacter populi]|uniref:RsmB/NOP family class I SAM-dependent RNA methyltransferase n=1 Tax=Corticibacter populi TaxID=1550736 RepID=A0A3M6QYM3_9BURK|nr:RsmB/NOP family class I SAM-dependent RNA methyltransferase [Corticibacter populi]RMX08126.1 RsmB/NOP family class I SAM-dependent RNA methyltransferase [Corticibacter populi]RZS35378.1 16S rRNA (cytosine967-C5)-methyltransferase [Corticibacter populi]